MHILDIYIVDISFSQMCFALLKLNSYIHNVKLMQVIISFMLNFKQKSQCVLDLDTLVKIVFKIVNFEMKMLDNVSCM